MKLLKKSTKQRKRTKNSNFLKKITKLLLTGIFGLAPVAFLAANCSAKSLRFDGNEDNKLVFAHSFSAKSPITDALVKIVELWNLQQKNRPNFIPMEIVNLASGYTAASETIERYLVSKDRIKLPNLVPNYSSLLAIVNKYGMSLPIVSDFWSDLEPANATEKSLKNFLKNNAIPEFLEINAEVPFLDPKGIYTIPFAKSTEYLAIDNILFGWIIKKATESPIGNENQLQKATIKNEDAEFFKKFTDSVAVKTDDVKKIEEIWKDYVPVKDGLAGYEFKKSDLENFSDLQKLSSRILKSFPNALSGSTLSSAKSVLGIDNSVTLIYSLSRSLNNADRTKEIAVLNKEKQIVDYTSYLNDPKSARYQQFNKVYDLITSGIDDKSTYFSTSGEYNSIYFRNHQMVFSIGTTAGVKYNAVEGTTKNTYSVSYQFGENSEKTSIFYPINTGYSAVIEENNLADVSKDLVLKPLDPSKNKYGTVKISAKYLPKIKELLQKNPNKKLFYFSDANPEAAGLPQESYQILDKEPKYKPTVIPGFLEIKEQKGSASVNEGEFSIEPAPYRFDKNSKTSIIFAQGPDLIPIHSTAKEDAAVKEFLNWILTEKVDFGAGGKITPIEFFAKSSSYLLPLKSIFEKNIYNPKDLGQTLAFNSFKKFSDENSKKGYHFQGDVADAISADFRKTLHSTIMQVQNLRSGSGKKQTFAEFLKLLQTNLGPAFLRQQNN